MDAIYKDKRTGLMLPDSLRPQAKGYGDAGASHTRRALKGFDASSGSPHEDIDRHNDTLRQRSRMLYHTVLPENITDTFTLPVLER